MYLLLIILLKGAMGVLINNFNQFIIELYSKLKHLYLIIKRQPLGGKPLLYLLLEPPMGVP